MALFVLLCVLCGFPAAAYRRTPRCKPLCGLDQNKNYSFMNRTPIVFILNSWDFLYSKSLNISGMDNLFFKSVYCLSGLGIVLVGAELKAKTKERTDKY